MDREEILKDIDQMTDEELRALLSDEQTAEDADLIIAYREAKVKEAYAAPDSSKAWERFHAVHIAPKKARNLRLWSVLYTAIAAAAMLVLLVGWQFLVKDKVGSGADAMLAFTANDAPKEILISTDNDQPQGLSQIKLDNENVIVKETMIDFSHAGATNAPARIKTVSTPRGKAYTVVLPDGSRAILNADSKLLFPSRFTSGNREVQLIGEAYFEVKKDAAHPFIVKTEKVVTRVLGTEFNLTAYPESDVSVTLISGSVMVNDEVTLKPGENVLVDGEECKVTTVDTEYYTQWKDGYFYFDNVPLVDVLVELGRWYNVNIELQNRRLMSYRLHFIADRNASIDDAIERLNEFRYLHAERVGDKIIVSEKNIQQQAP